MSAEHTLTDDDVLILYLSGYMSGAATLLEAVGESREDAVAHARELIGRMVSDPAVRETVLHLFRTGGGASHLPVPQHDEGGAP